MPKTTALFPVLFSVLLTGCVKEQPVIKVEKVPLSIPDNLLSCTFPPDMPPKPVTGDDGITTSAIIEALWAAGADCKTKLDGIKDINGK